jgi:hypothetical protein
MVLLLAGAALAWALTRVDLVVSVVAATGIAAVAVSSIAVSIAALRTRARLTGRRGEPLVLEEGTARPTGFAVRWPVWVPWVELSWSWIEPIAEVQLGPGPLLRERVTPRRRATVTEVVRRIVVTDAFGLARIALNVRERRDVRVLPAMGRLGGAPLSGGPSAGTVQAHPDGRAAGERVDSRQYAPGDPARRVQWKTFARTGELVVRTPERAFEPAEQTVAYLIAGPGDDAAAGAARAALERGELGAGVALGADGAGWSTDPLQHLDTVLRSHVGASSLSELIDATNPRRLVVFAPGSPGPWLDRLAASAPPDLELVVVLGVDGLSRPATPHRLLLPEPAQGITAADLTATLRRLGGDVRIADRVVGKVHSARQLRGWLERAS